MAASDLFARFTNQPIQSYAVDSSQLGTDLGTTWPYSPGANEAALQIGGVFGVTGRKATGAVSLPTPLTFPLNGGDIPIKSLPSGFSWLSDALDSASTFWETIYGEGFNPNLGCKRGTRWGKYAGVSIQGAVPGLDPPTVDGGHPVPVLINIIEDPITTDGGKTVRPGLPIFTFLYPGTMDVWGVFVITKDDHNEITADAYTPTYGGIRDKAGPIQAGDRKVAHGLYWRVRKMGTVDAQGHPVAVQSGTYDELLLYFGGINEVKNGDWCQGFTLAGLGWFLETAGEFVVAAIIEIAKDVAAAIGGLACDLLKDPQAAQALVLGLSVIAGGPGKGQNPQALAAACQAPIPTQCPVGYILQFGICQPAPSQIPWIPILIIGGVLTFLILGGGDKKPKPAPAASP